MEYKYKAFISYRHLVPDMQAAEKLQKLLEGYKPPKSLGLPKESRRIFRDVSELQSSSDLSEDIKKAIESSEYLIVICSPEYTKSKWCMQELTRFRELHGNTNQNIITLLVSGRPEEAFPKELTFTEMTTVNADGEKVSVQAEVEPLAANITADTLKESMKKLNTEFLRIAAPLLGCDFNDLFQREKRREASRRRRIFGGVFAVLSLITVISIFSAVTISGKNVQIQEQNNQIKAQNEQIEQKNNDLLAENAGHLAVESENLFRESSLIPAIQKAVAALPKEGEAKPVLPEAEYALSRELGMFEHSQIVPQRSLRHEYAVEQISFMGGGKTVVSQDATGVYFWNAETGGLISKLDASDSEFAAADGGPNKLTAIFDLSLDKTGTYYDYTSSPNSITYEVSAVFGKIYTNYVHAVDDDEPGTGGDVYVTNSDSTVWRVDGATGAVKWKAPASEKAHTYFSVKLDEKYVLREFQDEIRMTDNLALPGNDVYLELLDRETGVITDCVKLTAASQSAFSVLMNNEVQTVRDGVIYMACSDDDCVRTYAIRNHETEQTAEIAVEPPFAGGVHHLAAEYIGDDPLVTSCSVLAFNTQTSFTRYDNALSDEPLWRAVLPVNYLNGGAVFLMPAADTGYTHDVLAVLTAFSLSFLDFEDGTVIKNIPLGSEVVDQSFSRYGLVMFTVKDGEEYVVSLGHYTTGNASDNAAYRVQTMNTALSLCSYSRGRYVTAENYSNTAYIQYVTENPQYTDIDAGEYMYARDVPAVSADGAYAAVCATYYPDGKYISSGLVSHFFIYQPESGTLTEVSALKGYDIKSAAFAGEKTLIVNAKKSDAESLSDDEILRVDVTKCTAEKLDAPAVRRAGVSLASTECGVFYLSDSEENLVFVSPDGTWTAWGTYDESKFSYDREVLNAMYAVSGSKAAIYAKLHDEGSKTALVVYDFAGGQQVTLARDDAEERAGDVLRIFWQNAETVGVFFDNRTVSLFDAATGKRSASVSLSGTGQEPVSAAPVSDTAFAVLCRDAQIYEMNASGFTGRSCRLDFKEETENSIRESDSTNANLFEMKQVSGRQAAFAVWDGTQAWLLDPDRFTVRYRVDHYACAPSEREIVFVRDGRRNRIGFFPIYATDALLDTANAYLTMLGEAGT